MLKYSTFTIVLFAVSVTGLPSERNLAQLFQKGVSDEACIIKYCSELSIKCVANLECIEGIHCSLGCLKNWDSDTTPQKYGVQNCTNKCAFTHGESEAYQSFMGCVTDHNCISFPPIPSTCKGSSVKTMKQLTTKDLEGNWWMQHGYNKVYDCYPCHTEDYHFNGSSLLYHTEYDTYLVDGSTKHVATEEVWPNTQPGEVFKYSYRDLGIMMNEQRWLVDKADDNSWFIMYYCGISLNTWNYEGAEVLSKNKTLDSSAYAQIAASYKQAVGIDFNDFCAVKNDGSSCTQK